jgi:RNase P subunit RPR2
MARVVVEVPKKMKRVVCRDGCRATIEYVPNDVKRRDGTDYGGGPDGEEWVVCPSCGKKAIIRSW